MYMEIMEIMDKAWKENPRQIVLIRHQFLLGCKTFAAIHFRME